MFGNPLMARRRAVAGDPYWSYTRLLIFPGPADSSAADLATGKAITAYGDATLSAAVADPWGGTRKVLRFDGSGDYLSLADNADWAMGSGDFTVDFWMRAIAGNAWLFGQYDGASLSSISFRVLYTSGGAFDIRIGQGSSQISTGGGSLPLGTWAHVAMVRAGSSLKGFLNGAQIGSTTVSGAINDSTHPLSIGREGALGSQNFNGYMTAFRITKGVARPNGGYDGGVQPLTS